MGHGVSGKIVFDVNCHNRVHCDMKLNIAKYDRFILLQVYDTEIRMNGHVIVRPGCCSRNLHVLNIV